MNFLQTQRLLIITFGLSAFVGQATEAKAISAPNNYIDSFTISTLFSQSTSTKVTKNTNVKFVRPKLPEGVAPGGRRTGGGRRDTCPSVNPQLTALVPVTEEADNVKNVWGLTTAEHPTLWFYIPYTKSFGYPTEFVLLNDNSVPIYKKNVSLPEQPGIINITLPTSISPLEFNKHYRWFLKVYCTQEKQSRPIYVEGVVSRVSLSEGINQQLQNASPQQKLAIYAQNGIWYQALEILVQLKQENPRNSIIQNSWNSLLTNIGLDEIVDESILYQPPNHSKLINSAKPDF
ncbi:MAG: DUF928 domain-containing protein [Calothrix sp. C42_A2020_038]|nr:DUF928 domain-containing protein [Calothrix sp. C42_A2020_038]